MENLRFIEANKFVPVGQVASTARLGHAWDNRVFIGDVVNLQVTETGESFGRAVVVAKELTTLGDVLANADHNVCAFNPQNACLKAEEVLLDELDAAYKEPLFAHTQFTVLHILRIDEDSLCDEDNLDREDCGASGEEASAGLKNTLDLIAAAAAAEEEGIGIAEITESTYYGDIGFSRTIKFADPTANIDPDSI